MKFQEWINAKYKEWQSSQPIGNSGSVANFARWLSVDRSTVNSWIRDGFTPSSATLPKIAKKFPEVYSILGMPSPSSVAAWNKLPPEVQASWTRKLMAARAKASESGIDIEALSDDELIDFVSPFFLDDES